MSQVRDIFGNGRLYEKGSFYQQSDSNPGQVGMKREVYHSAIPSPLSFFWSLFPHFSYNYKKIKILDIGSRNDFGNSVDSTQSLTNTWIQTIITFDKMLKLDQTNFPFRTNHGFKLDQNSKKYPSEWLKKNSRNMAGVWSICWVGSYETYAGLMEKTGKELLGRAEWSWVAQELA